ncbi:B3 domain-containing protein [Panicum miliaceum]|uniref:B3 domain-containing protein n=1 Tax=Panicum miliaceum TaxID=4540 RepID=A0A3L6QK69_PANMI|nr:B3 domain-containing protein [Panicum miliaceum]
MSGGGSEVKNRKTSIDAFLEKGKQKEGRTNSNKNMMADDQEKEERIIWNGHNKVKSTKKVSTASPEKMKKQKLCNANKKKKMQIDDDEEGKNRHNGDHKLTNRKESPTLCEKDKNKEKLNKTHKEKMWAADRKERKILSRHNSIKSGEVSTAFFGKEKKGKRLNKTKNEELQRDEDEENAPFTSVVKEKRMRPSESTEAMMCHEKPNRRSVSSIVSKEKKIDTSSGSKYKKRKRGHTLPKKGKRSDNKIHSGRVQEKKICGGGKEKNKHTPFTSFAFFKFIYNRFEEFLLIPPAVAHKLTDLSNQHVYLEDSEERRSKVRLSVVNDSLTFHQGWNIFVSDHSIKRGEFLLFEYIATKTFSVRVFGMNSRERLCFKKGPKKVQHGVGSGPAQQDNNNENYACMRSQVKTAILISDSGASAHNEDVVNLTTSDADSTHYVTINTNKDLERVQSGVGNLPDGECGTKCISPACNEGKTSSETIVNDAAPLMHENDGRVGNELQVHDLDEDLIRKQGINCIPLGSIIAVEKHQIHNTMNISQNFCRKYAAPGGFRCLEKLWRAGIVNSRAALDGTVLIEPENTEKTDSKLVDGDGSIGLNTVDEYFCSEGNHTHVPPVFTMAVKGPLGADRHGEKEIDHSINEKCGGAAIQIETQGEQLEHMGSIVNSQRNNIPVSANAVVPGKYRAIGLNPVGPEVTCAIVEPMLTVPVEKPSSPDEISKYESSRTEIDHNVNGKGTIVQLETKVDQVEPVGSSVCSQSSNNAMYGNCVAAHVSEHCFSKQEGRKSINCAVQESLLPMEDKILESDDHSLLKFSLQLCVPDTTRKWLELPKSLPNAVKQKRHDRNVILLNDPMKRLWPVLYHENPVFVGFTAGWRNFVAANNLQAGDLCDLIKEPDDDEPVYSVLITRQ